MRENNAFQNSISSNIDYSLIHLCERNSGQYGYFILLLFKMKYYHRQFGHCQARGYLHYEH